MPDVEINGLVARVIASDELIINRGSLDGVTVDMIFAVVDERTQSVTDPVTEEDLGSIERMKAKIYITDVAERIALAKSMRRQSFRSIIAASDADASRRTILGSSQVWPEGVRRGDEVRFTGNYVKREAK
ncbi:hypothetical protein [Amycolatopsis sp. WAC 04182]|uniref:hypothetical protein n=1 Tax=Amycolatopsis sp. WAC 04182 TaxID=2203198 RepID=UPI000F79C09E|nr:hypothetical protein [Amycolatopsis sp. WAC 04182]